MPKLPLIQATLKTCSPSSTKEDKRERLNKDIDQFLTNGGTIKQIPTGITAFGLKISMNRSQRAVVNRHEALHALERKRIKEAKERDRFSFLPKFLR